MSEQSIAYLITRSAERFAVWINVRALPRRIYSAHLPASPASPGAPNLNP
ncbi:MAG: hypothetical protein HC800_03475 [Phormidesmis sp. RL_2_1]|nr:hypothetical protein [Phormidesmis sp. RL_2_1]